MKDVNDEDGALQKTALTVNGTAALCGGYAGNAVLRPATVRFG